MMPTNTPMSFGERSRSAAIIGASTAVAVAAREVNICSASVTASAVAAARRRCGAGLGPVRSVFSNGLPGDAGRCDDRFRRSDDQIDRDVMRSCRHALDDLQIEGADDARGLRCKKRQQAIVIAAAVTEAPPAAIEGHAR